MNIHFAMGNEIGAETYKRNHTNQNKFPPTANPKRDMAACGIISPNTSTNETESRIATISGTILSKNRGSDSIANALNCSKISDIKLSVHTNKSVTKSQWCLCNIGSNLLAYFFCAGEP